MGIKRRQYSKEQKEEMVQKTLSGKSILALGKENNISPGLINRWRRQYLDGELYFKKRERIPTTEEKRGFIHHYRSLFESIKEGCRLMGIKRSTLYYRAKDNLQ